MDYTGLFEGKVILITGGTGFLGRALIKEILKYNPQSIRVFSRDEVKHHNVQEIFHNDERLRNFIGDIRDSHRLKKAMFGANIVIHAAALKRLDILEYNVEEVIKTNIIGTLNVVEAALETNVDRVIFVSTDKACSPVNTYGACKFVGERIFIETNYNRGTRKTIFSCVRYGNVLESTGSVIPFFENKIKNHEKIPVTDLRMTRFIISPEQAVELIFTAIKYGVGGEIFVPKLPAFKLPDLIEILNEKHNLKSEIENIGLRPGEKIHELMINEAEIPRTYDFHNTYVIISSITKYITISKAEYVNENKKLNEEKMKVYSSLDAVISKEKVKELFTNLGLL
jgi:UDP-N-acetylglucosamine 4,6-dehydratase/UDP-glucose 4-epimerase